MFVFLFLWFFLTLGVSGVLTKVTPPGGVHPAYYFIVPVLIAAAVWHAASYDDRLFIALVYGLLTGYIFAWPVLTDCRTELAVALGYTSYTTIAIKIILFTCGIVGLSVGTFALRHLCIRRFSSHATSDQGVSNEGR